MSLRQRLLLFALAAIVAIAASSALVVIQGRNLSGTLLQIAEAELAPATELNALEGALQRIRTRTMAVQLGHYSSRGGHVLLVDDRNHMRDHWRRFVEGFRRLPEDVSTSHRPLVDKIEARMVLLEGYLEQVDAAIIAEDMPQLNSLIEYGWVEFQIELIKPLFELIEVYDNLRANSVKSASEAAAKFERAAWLIMVVSILLLTVAMFGTLRRIYQGLQKLAKGLSQLAERRYESIDDTGWDEIAVMTRQLDATARLLHDDREQILALKNQNEAIVMSLGEGLYGTDAPGRISFINPAGAAMLGWTAEKLIGKPAHLTMHHTYRDGRPHPVEDCPLYHALKDGCRHETNDDLFWRRDGSSFDVRVVSMPLRGAEGDAGAVVSFSDISAIKKAERDLHEEKQWSESIVQLAPSLIVGLTPAGQIVLFNDHAERVTGYRREEVLGRDWVSLFTPAEAQADIGAIISSVTETGELVRHKESPILIRDGSHRIVSWSSDVMRHEGQVRMILSLGLDVTERRHAEQQLQKNYAELKALNQKLAEAQSQVLQSEKMASIGQLAAGVAHEINNPIGFVNSNLGSLQTYCEDMLRLIDLYLAGEDRVLNPDEQARVVEIKQRLDIDYLREDIPALLKESMDGLQRVKKIVLDLKGFSHVDQLEWQLADLNAGLESTLNIVWNEIKYKAEVSKEYGQIPPVECLAAQVNQIFMNLLVNAAQAIDPSQQMGKIILRTGQRDDMVWIDVEDSGQGMSEDVRKRIFEPFYTTKPVGKGTGLGLSVSFNIAEKHGGRIEVRSAPGEGSCFSLWLPIKRKTDE